MMCSNRLVAGVFLALLPLGSILALGGCAGRQEAAGSHATNVEGRMLHASETFTGESTAGSDGNGSISLISDRGARCSGTYRQVPDGNTAEVRAEASNNGVATLSCSDGRTGSVMFTVAAGHAIGTGMLGQDILTLTIED
jgi:hypothetical protein